jgi:hypothetical protein
MRGMRLVIAALALLILDACTRRGQPVPVAPMAGVESPSKSRTNELECLATLPTGDHRREDPAGLGHQGYGNGELWVGLWPGGHARATKDNVNRLGEIVMKFPWDRGVRGNLQISGRRVDAEASPLRVHLSDYGLTGFQPAALVFPTEGCWEVTGRVGRSSLTFVTRVTLIH